VGPTVLRSASLLEVGQMSAPIRSGTGFHIVRLSDREPPRTPRFEEVTKQVRVDWRRRQGDKALRNYLADLRARAEIEIAPGIPGASE